MTEVQRTLSAKFIRDLKERETRIPVRQTARAINPRGDGQEDDR